MLEPPLVPDLERLPLPLLLPEVERERLSLPLLLPEVDRLLLPLLLPEVERLEVRFYPNSADWSNSRISAASLRCRIPRCLLA